MEELKIFIWAMTPIGELRAAIPIGLALYKLNPFVVYFFSVSGNVFASFLILISLGAFSRWTSKNIDFFNRFFTWLFSQTRKNHYNKVNKYGLYLLPFFVAVPLPITGAWTASLIAFVFGMPFKKSFPLISAGILAAGLIVLFLTKTGVAIEKNFGWQMLIAIALISGVVYYLYNKNNNKINQRG